MTNVNNLGLLNSLCELINSDYYSGNHAIATYLVQNISRINNLTVNEIVDNAFVSRSAVRRFCENLGYLSFTDLKLSISKLIFPSDIRHRNKYDYQINSATLTKLITTMLTDINYVFPKELVQKIVNELHKHKHVILLCANNTSGTLIKFQQELMYANKVIIILDQNYQNNSYLSSLQADSLLLTVSTSGKYAEISNDFIKKLPGKKMLITGNKSKKFKSTYDEIFYISKESFSEDYLGIYGKYGITYIFDQIFLKYVTTYPKD